MIRPMLSLKRLFFDETAGKVCYQYSRHGSQEESMDYLEFIGHLKITFQAELPTPPQIVQQQLLMGAEESGEYFT